jgi:hypothetical protein
MLCLPTRWGDWSASWSSWVQPEVAKTTRVCTYDRAGMGWSEADPLPRTAEQFAKELHMSSHRQHMFADQSGHNIQPDQPEAAVAAIVQMVGQLRCAQAGCWPAAEALRDYAGVGHARAGAGLAGSRNTLDSLAPAQRQSALHIGIDGGIPGWFALALHSMDSLPKQQHSFAAVALRHIQPLATMLGASASGSTGIPQTGSRPSSPA